MNGTPATAAQAAAQAAALAHAREAVADAGLRGLCREGREAIAVDVLQRHGLADAAHLAAGVVSEAEQLERP